MDEVTSIADHGKVTKLALKTTVGDKSISIIIDRPLGGDEATCLRLPAGTSRKLGRRNPSEVTAT